MTADTLRRLLDLAEEARESLEGIDAGEDNEAITIAWGSLNEIHEALWDAYTTQGVGASSALPHTGSLGNGSDA